MKKLITIIMIAVLVFSFTVQAEAKSYECDSVESKIKLLDNGNATIDEYWTFTYEGGPYTRAFKAIPKKDNYSIKDIKVYDNDGKPYTQIDNFDSNRPVGKYAVEESKEEYRIEWYYKAEDVTKTFKISYAVENAVKIHNDTAEFNWQVTGADWDIPMGNVSATVSLPSSADSISDIKVWAHGPLNGNVKIDDTSNVSLDVGYVPSNQFVEVRMLAPVKLFYNSSNHTGQDALSSIMAEEQGNADRANKMREESRKLVKNNIIGGAFTAVLGIILAFISSKQVKRYKPVMKPEYCRDLPSDISPAELPYLVDYYKYAVPGDSRFTATLMDLCLKGYIEFEYRQSDRNLKSKDAVAIKIKKQADSKLKLHERIILDFIANDVGSSLNGVTPRDIEKYGQKHNRESAKIFSEFDKQVKESIENRGYFDNDTKGFHKKPIAFIIILVLMCIVGISMKLYAVTFVSVIFIIVNIIVMANLKRLTQNGEDEFALWEGFKKFITDFTSFDEKELPDIILWEKYLVYATVLGVADKVLKQLPIHYPQLQDQNYTRTHTHYMYMFYDDRGNFGTANAFSDLNSIGQSIQSAITVASSSNSSGSGGGGGFSSGGGRGGGGGGGGCD